MPTSRRTTGKMIVLVFILAAFIVGIGLYGMRQMRAINQNTNSLVKDRTIPLQQFNDIRFYYSKTLVGLLSRKQFSMIDFVGCYNEILEAETAIEKNWVAYKATMLTDREKDLILEVELSMLAGKNTLTRLKKALNERDENSVKQLTASEFAMEVREIINGLNDLGKLQIEIANQLEVRNNNIYSRLKGNYTSSILILLCISFFLAWFFISQNRRQIRDLEKAKQLISESEERCRAFIKYAGDAILILNERLEITDANESAVKLLGYSFEEMMHLGISDLIPENQRADLEKKKDIIDKMKGSLHERKLIRKDGSEVETEVNVRGLSGQGYVSIIRDISERKLLEEKQSLLSLIVQNSNDAIISKTMDGRVTSWNEGAEKIFGYRAEEMIGYPVTRLFPAELLEEEEMIMSNILKGQSVDHYETVRISKEGKKLNVSITVSPIRNRNGKVVGASKIARDITDRKLAEEALKASENQYRYLFENNPAYIIIWDLENFEILEVNEMVVERYGYSREDWLSMNVFQYRHESDHQRIREFAKKMLNDEEKVVQGVWQHLRKDGEVMQMEINSHKIIYNNRKAILSLGRDVTEQVRIEKELRKSEERHRALVENINDAITLINEEGQLLYRSPSVERINGYSFDDVKNKQILDLIHPDHHEATKELLKQAYSFPGRKLRKELLMRHKKGHFIWIDVTIRNLFHLESVGALVINYVDITEKKEADLAIREQAEIFRAIIENTTESIMLISPDFRLIQFNQTAADSIRTGRGMELKIGEDFRKYIYPDQEEMFYEMFSDALRGVNRMEELQALRVSGEKYWFLSKLSPVYNLSGKLIGVRLLAESIQERKKAELRIKESEEKFRSLVEQSLVGVIILQHTQFKYVNPGFERLSGYSKDELLDNIYFHELIHPDDLNMVQGYYAARIVDEAAAAQYTFRAIRKDGQTIYLEAFVSRILINGQPAVIATLADISERILEEKRIGKAVIEAQENERMQIGMELHDNVKQIMAASIMMLDIVLMKMENKEEAIRTIGRVKGYIAEAITELRRLSHQLAPSADAEEPLKEKILRLSSVMNRDDKIKLKLEVEEFYPVLGNEVQTAIYRILQEQFNNIIKYANAGSVFISLQKRNDQVELKIKDDGRGFDISAKKDGIGLINIRRRAKVLGGEADIQSSPGNGCEIVVKFPIQGDQA